MIGHLTSRVIPEVKECDVCSVVDIVLYKLEVGLHCH